MKKQVIMRNQITMQEYIHREEFEEYPDLVKFLQRAKHFTKTKAIDVRNASRAERDELRVMHLI